MQRILGTAAPLATLILFVAVAASSKATLVLLSFYGLIFMTVGPVAGLVFLRRAWKRRLPREPMPRSVRFAPYVFGVLMVLASVYSLVNPAHESEWSGHELTSFGFSQGFGLFGLGASILLALALATKRQRGIYRECPHCLSRIRREATRCRYCTAEVDPAPRSQKVIEQRPLRETSTAAGGRRLPPRYATPGRKKKDFGQLSAPRVTSTGTRVSTRPSERDNSRRQSNAASQRF